MAEALPSEPQPVVRELTAPERATYFRGIHPIWGNGLPLERFVAFQEAVARSDESADRYRIFGLWPSASGALRSGMKAYDLPGSFQGRALRILGIGAVFTPPSHRGQGHAATLLAAVLSRYADQGFDAALLFSDIGAEYYARLGFRLLESLECVVPAAVLPPARPLPLTRAGQEEELVQLLARCRPPTGALSLPIDGWVQRLQLRRQQELARARDVPAPGWGMSVTVPGGGAAAALVRVGGDAVDLMDAAWTSSGARDRLLAGLRALLEETGRSQLRCWPAHQLRDLFPADLRQRALAMIAPLKPGVPLPGPRAPAELTLGDHI